MDIAEQLDQQLEELAEELSENEDSAEIKDQIQKARELAKSLEEPGTDLEKALEQSQDNPVFYVQYAHARCRSVLRNAGDKFEPHEITPSWLAEAHLDRLEDPA